MTTIYKASSIFNFHPSTWTLTSQNFDPESQLAPTLNLHMIIHGFAFGKLQNRTMSIICKSAKHLASLYFTYLPGCNET
jgi:hypothetical protein